MHKNSQSGYHVRFEIEKYCTTVKRLFILSNRFEYSSSAIIKTNESKFTILTKLVVALFKKKSLNRINYRSKHSYHILS